MEEKIKITAIIRTKDNEDTICDTLESIKDLDEIIIVDNHSTDDTTEIAKEYKTKLVYANTIDLPMVLSQVMQEAKNEWIFILNNDEIIPQKLIYEIQKYIQNPKKNKNCCSFHLKNFYLNKEIKSAKEKNVLRLFKKDHATFKNDFSLEIETNKKIHKIKPSANSRNACILKFNKAPIAKEIIEIVEYNKNLIKEPKKIKPSIFIKPAKVFFYYYFIKGGFKDGANGFIYAKKKYIQSFIFEVMLQEKMRNNNDIR